MIDNNIIYSIIVFSFFLLLKMIFKKVIIPFFKKIATKTKTTFDDQLIDTIKQPLEFLILLTGILFAKNILQLETNIDIPKHS